MIVVWILLGLLGLIALLLLLPLRINLQYDPENGFRYYARYLFFKFEPSEEPNEKLNQQIFSILGLSDVQTVSNAKQAVSAKGVASTLQELGAVLKTLLDRVFWLLRRGAFRRFRLQILVGGEDAAEAAYGYGLVCAAVYPLLGLLESAIRFRQRQVDICCDYSREDTRMTFSGQFQLRPWQAVAALIYLVGKNAGRTLQKEKERP